MYYLFLSIFAIFILFPLPTQCGKAVLAGGLVSNYNYAVYDAFISQASPSGKTPYIGVITAGTSLDIAKSTANDIIAELKGIYGLKNVVWLPYHPENGTTCTSTAWNSALDSMTGLYFNGGNSEPMIDCFLPNGKVTSALSIMKTRYASGSLALYGSSAGTVIFQTTPVLQIQDSWNALVYGPIYASQGFSIFPHGFLDVHFSTRGRIGAFTRLIYDKKSLATIGFGVDQDTAMVLSSDTSFSVVGTAGVYIIDVGSAVKGSTSTTNKNQWAIRSVRVHYLTSGDGYNYGTKVITLARGKTRNLGKKVSATYSNDIFADSSFTTIAKSLFASSTATSTYGITSEIDPEYRVNLRKTSVSEAFSGTINGVAYTSFINLYIDIYCYKNC